MLGTPDTYVCPGEEEEDGEVAGLCWLAGNEDG